MLTDREHRHIHTVVVDLVDYIVGASAATSMPLRETRSLFEP